MQNESSLAVLVNVFASPNEAFAAIKERPRVLLPLLLLFIGGCLVSVLYMSGVDLAWYLDAQMQTNAALTEAQRNDAVQAALRIPPLGYAAIGGIGSIAFVLVVLAIGALYYSAMSFFTADGVRYKQWFALSCWCLMPTLLGLVAQIVNLSVSDVRFMMQDAINPLSFGNLLGIKPAAGVTMVQRVLLGLDVTTLWAIALAVLGYHAFTNSSLVKSAAIVLGPVAVIALGATAFALLKS